MARPAAGRILVCALFAALLAAPEAGADWSAKGLAVVRVRSKRAGDVVFQQAVFLAPDGARFLALDEFGGVPFTVSFGPDGIEFSSPEGSGKTGSGKLKRLLSLPLKQDEFLSLLRHAPPATFAADPGALPGEETWRHVKRKKFTARYSDFLQGPSQPYFPARVVLEYKKNLFDLKWQSVEFQNYP